MKTLNLAVVGKDVSKSSSPQIHAYLAKKLGYNVNYIKYSLPEEEFSSQAESLFTKFDGFNVTIPYKLSIIPYLNKIEGDALTFGAVNTVKSAARTGNNTDGVGFELMLKNNAVNVYGKNVLLLGAGGAGRSIAKKLADGGANVFLYNRSREKALKIAQEFGGITVLDKLEAKPYYAIINATSVGMHQTEGVSPVDEKIISLCEVAVDIIYTPQKTEFLRLAESLGKKIINGLAMLFYQAYFAACIFAEITPNAEQAKILFNGYLKETK